MRAPLYLTGALSLASMASAGCSIASTPDAPDAEATAHTATAIVVVERTAGPGDALRADALVARFVRVRQGAVDDQALRVAGASWDLPPSGTCSVFDASGAAAPSASATASAQVEGRNIELLDVGALTLGDSAQPSSATTGAGRSTVLLPRTMFDPTGGVSGVVYSGRAADAFSPSSRLQLRTAGGPDLPDGFAVNVTSPREVSDVRVTTLETTPPSLDVSWDTDAETDETRDPRDVVYVDVLSTSARLLARCTTTDTGRLTIAPFSSASSASSASSFPSGSLEEGQLAVHRLHRESFRTKGIEPGEIRFDVARVVTFHR